VLSGSEDKTTRLWDTAMGAAAKSRKLMNWRRRDYLKWRTNSPETPESENGVEIGLASGCTGPAWIAIDAARSTGNTRVQPKLATILAATPRSGMICAVRGDAQWNLFKVLGS
jgi:hypothetical protein